MDLDALGQVLVNGVPPDLQMEYYALCLRVIDAEDGKAAHDEESVKPLIEFVQWAKAHPAEFSYLGAFGDAPNAEINAHVIRAKLILDGKSNPDEKAPCELKVAT